MQKIIQKLKNNNISIWLSEANIKLAYGNDTPPEQVINEIREQKPEIVAYLEKHGILSEEAFNEFVSEHIGLKNNPGIAEPSSKPADAIEAIFPASSLQQGFVYHYLNCPDDNAYRIQLLLDYKAELDLTLYKEAWRLASVRYPILRVAFNWDREILQIVTTKPGITDSHFNFVDISDLSAEQKIEKIESIQRQDLEQPFDLTKPGLIRFTVMKQSESLFTVLKTEHHSIADGWSGPLLLNTVHSYYDQLKAGETPIVEVDKAYMEVQAYNRDNIDKQWKISHEKFGNANDLNVLFSSHLDLDNTKAVKEPGEAVLSIKGEDYQVVKGVCQSLGVTINAVLQFAWHKLLHEYTRDKQTIVGTTISGRDVAIEGIESSVGLYINTLPLALNWDDDATVKGLLQEIQLKIAELNSYSSVPLSSLQKSGKRLFHSLFVFENYPVSNDASTKAEGIAGQLEYRYAVENVDYPVCLTAYEHNSNLVIKLKYGEAWLDEVQSARLLQQLKTILKGLSQHSGSSHKLISLLTEREKDLLVNEWGKGDQKGLPEDSLIQQFRLQVNKSPENIAVQCDEGFLTYRQLALKVDKLASALKAVHLQRGTGNEHSTALVGLYFDSDMNMVISIMAALKAGLAYVPLSPVCADEYVAKILANHRIKTVLSAKSYVAKLDSLFLQVKEPPRVISVDETTEMQGDGEVPQWEKCLQEVHDKTKQAVVLFDQENKANRGISFTQENLMYLADSFQSLFGEGTESILQFAELTQPNSLAEIFGALLTGRQLHLIKGEVKRFSNEFVTQLEKQPVDLAILPTSFVALMTQESTLVPKTLVIRGRMHSHKLLDALQRRCNLFTLYGSAETAGFSTIARVNSDINNRTIGRPVANSQIYLMDSAKKLVPEGVYGEIYLTANHLGKSYPENNEAVREHSFTDDVVQHAEVDDTLFRTGAIARWTKKGDLEYLGCDELTANVDDFTVYLEQVEAALKGLPAVNDAVVVMQESRDSQKLVAYTVVECGKATSEQRLKEQLSGVLPEHMLPAAFVLLEYLPLTMHGCPDLHALPPISFESQPVYTAPRNELESKLCEIWQDIFVDAQSVSVYDNFFALGGNSITAIRLAAAARRTLDIDIPLQLLYEKKTIAELAAHVSECHRVTIPKANLTEYPLSFAQERLLFIESYQGGGSLYHVPLFVKLGRNINVEALEAAFNTIVNRHTVLKSVYRANDDKENYQCVEDLELAINWSNVSDFNEIQADVVRRINTAFDLSRELSIRLHGYNSKENKFLLILWHHIAFDGWSAEIFMREISHVYQAYNSNKLHDLPPLEISYADYAAWQKEFISGERLSNLKEFWLDALSGFETLSLPTDYPRPMQFDHRGSDFNFELSPQLSSQLRDMAKRLDTTMFCLLLSAFYVTLNRICGQQDIVIGTPSDNRHHIQTQGPNRFLCQFSCLEN